MCQVCKSFLDLQRIITSSYSETVEEQNVDGKWHTIKHKIYECNAIFTCLKCMHTWTVFGVEDADTN